MILGEDATASAAHIGQLCNIFLYVVDCVPLLHLQWHLSNRHYKYTSRVSDKSIRELMVCYCRPHIMIDGRWI